jgi:cysteine desulfurase/selenocysteine lyase
MDDLAAKIDDSTVLVTLSHVSNVLGVVNPVAEVCALAHEHGAACLVDGAQGMPHRKVDFAGLGCDFYAFSGHKMMGPMGIGGLLVARERLNEVEPFLGGGEMIDRVTLEGASFADPPLRFEAGTQNVGGVIGLAAAVRYLKGLGMDAVQAHERLIGEYARSKVGRIQGIRLIGPAPDKGGSGGILTFVVDGHHPHDTAQFLDERGIAVRAGDHCAQPLHGILGVQATTRASFYVYNTMADVDALADALKDMVLGRHSVTVSGAEDEAAEVLDFYYQNPAGRDRLDQWTVEVDGMNALCGDELTLRLNIGGNRIVGVQADARGCKVSQASASLMAATVRGMTVEEVLSVIGAVKSALMGEDVDLTGDLKALKPIAKMPARVKCAILAWNTLEEALKDGH